MSIRDEIRSEQEQEFTESEVYTERVKELTRSVYDQVDAMTNPQRRLFIETALGFVVKGAHALGEKHDDVMDTITFAMLASGISAVAGYALALIREEAAETATGDTAVTSVMSDLHDLTKESMLALVGGQSGLSVDTLRDIAKEAKAKFEAGVPEAEIKKWLSDRTGDQKPEPEPSYGLYL